MIFNRAARTAGKKPPMSPINKEKPSDVAMIDGERAKENANSEKELKFKVEMVKNCRREARSNPNAPPDREIKKDSARKATRTLRRRNPRARNVPISVVRFATEPYIVIIAPIIEPVLKIAVMKRPRTLINVAIISDCSWKNCFSPLGSKCNKRLSAPKAAANSPNASGFWSLSVSVEYDGLLNASMI